MTNADTVVDLLDDDDDDCVIQSVVYGECNKDRSSLYNKVHKESELLANFIEKCLSLENSSCMFNTLKNILLESYYKVEKSVRDSPKIQRALQRANNLLYSKPEVKYTHIKDLCEILKASHVKKKVSFITLTTDLKTTDKKSEVNGLKRNSEEPIDILGDSSKKPKLNGEVPPESTNTALNDTADSLDESVSTVNCSQESCVSEEESLLIAKKDIPAEPEDPFILAKEERIKNLERKIARYKNEIAWLDELEVTDDSVNSPYIRSERLKSIVVNLYKELCDLTGSRPVKKKGIHLQVIEGHPPGPTKVLENFLNKNIDSNGDLPFPDFYDVVNCVTESNEKDDLGWTRAQITKEAYMLFTHCGRALQKRRQRREYRNLLRKVKLEECDKDPADDDPELLARLEENRLISVKKETEILERFTMMQTLPSKAKPQLQNNQDKDSTDTQNTLINNNNHKSSCNNNTEEIDVDTTTCKNAPYIEQSSNHSTNDSELKSKTDSSETSNKDNGIILNTKDVMNKEIDDVLSDDQNKENNMSLHNKTRSCDIGVAKGSVSEDTPILQNQHNKTTIASSCTVDQKKTNTVTKTNNEDRYNEFDVTNNEIVAINESNTVSKNSVVEETPVLQNQHSESLIGVVVDQTKSNTKEITNNEFEDRTHEIMAVNNYNCDHNNKAENENVDKSTCHTATTPVGSKCDENQENHETNLILETEIKREPEEDIMKMLKSFGQNFSVSVQTVSDPFLIVEIASDSSDEE